MGRAVVTSPSQEKNRFLKDGINAVLVPPDDPGALARAIDQLRLDNRRRMAIGRAGRDLARRQFGDERLEEALRRVCDRALGKDSQHGGA
jgi:glycosyltransferase involved in cell wall biosynthesis